jgi:hypothetical protein
MIFWVDETVALLAKIPQEWPFASGVNRNVMLTKRPNILAPNESPSPNDEWHPV